MKTFWVLVGLSVAGVASATGRARLGGSEAPRATDLLRAETLAEQAEKRLRLPPHEGGGWKRGGSGWDTPAPRRTTESSPVTIRVSPPRRRAER